MLCLHGTKQDITMQQTAEHIDTSTLQPGSPDLEQALRSLDALRATLQSVVAAPVDENIPVLRDVVSRSTQPSGNDNMAGEQALADLLESLRAELDVMIDDMLSDARNRFEQLLVQSSEELKTAVRGRLESRIAEHFSAK
jgi:hypothetical protein